MASKKTAKTSAKTATAAAALRTAGGKDSTYTVWDGTVNGKTFATLSEASNYSNDMLHRTGEVLSVTETHRKVTHKYVGLSRITDKPKNKKPAPTQTKAAKKKR